jgi:NitT/TauT family transport system substrate-binding protein
MKQHQIFSRWVTAMAVAISCMGGGFANAADKVKVGVFPASAALPFYVAQSRGYFKDAGLDVEEVPMNSHPLTVQALVTGSIDAASNLVTLEAANMAVRRPDSFRYIALSGQNAKYVVEQFVVHADSTARSLPDIRNGFRLFSAPGPANIGAARAVLKKVGLVEGKDFTIQEQQISVHVGALQSGNFDGGYTLEPAASVMVDQKIGRRLEAGVISTYLLGRKESLAFPAGTILSSKFIVEKPEVASRFAGAWRRAVKAVESDSSTRGYLITALRLSPALATSVPLPMFRMVRDLEPSDKADFQKFLDIGVELGVVKDRIDANALLVMY